MDKRILKQFLIAGYIFDGILYRNRSGTPQGGLISPHLANMALDGMEQVLKTHFPGQKVHLIRFADDFVITAESREIAERCKEIVVVFLKDRGLELSEEKTEIVHINEGFDFIGWNFRKFKGKLLIQPSKKAVAAITLMLSETVKSAKAWTQDQLISRLNALIQYMQLIQSKAIFS